MAGETWASQQLRHATEISYTVREILSHIDTKRGAALDSLALNPYFIQRNWGDSFREASNMAKLANATIPNLRLNDGTSIPMVSQGLSLFPLYRLTTLSVGLWHGHCVV